MLFSMGHATHATFKQSREWRAVNMACYKCSKLLSEIRAIPATESSGSYPTILELAYMVNLEYYVKIGSTDCIHNIPEVKNARIPVSEMVGFLDENKWAIQAKTSHGGMTSQ